MVLRDTICTCGLAVDLSAFKIKQNILVKDTEPTESNMSAASTWPNS